MQLTFDIFRRRSTWPARAPRFLPFVAPRLHLPPGSNPAVAEPSPQSTADLNLATGIDWLRRMGVDADRRASRNLIGQLKLALHHPVDSIICTALAGETALRLGAAIAARFPAEVVAGVKLLRQILPEASATIAIEASSPRAWTKQLRQAAAAAKIRVLEMTNDYPQTDPTLMVYSLLKHRRLRPGDLPPQCGAVVVDAAAAMAIGQAVQGTRMTHVPVLLHDHASGESHSCWTPVGTMLGDLLEHLRITPHATALRAGELLRDIRVTPEFILAGGELVIHIIRGEHSLPAETCIRCGWCADICPTRVQPAVILDAAQQNDPQAAGEAGIHACIECGLCSHVCPCRLPLLEAIRGMQAKPET